ncbi:hypothetical protein CSB20_03875 [bacterium DOLZORAL124_64_63]|nr:MAG: hypothetical protein CSB20_03875 [bacterium DOLZORAL124_64_63]
MTKNLIKSQAAEVDPTTGKQRNTLRKNYWSVNIGRHVVFYTFTDTEIRIQRVLHGSMNVAGLQ